MADPTFVQCNSCGGIFRPVQADGMDYYHVCPTSRVVTGAVVDDVTGKVITAAVFSMTANPRDENLHRAAPGAPVTMKREGTGVTPVTEVALLKKLGLVREDA